MTVDELSDVVRPCITEDKFWAVINEENVDSKANFRTIVFLISFAINLRFIEIQLFANP